MQITTNIVRYYSFKRCLPQLTVISIGRLVGFQSLLD